MTDKKMLIYIGPMSGIVIDDPSINMMKDEPCEVPKKLADELLKNRPDEFKLSTGVKPKAASAADKKGE